MTDFKSALGVLELEANGVLTEIKPVMKDKRELLKISTRIQDGKFSENNLDDLVDFMVKIVSRDNPDNSKEDIEGWVIDNFAELIEQVMIGFKLTSRAEIEKNKRKTTQHPN